MNSLIIIMLTSLCFFLSWFFVFVILVNSMLHRVHGMPSDASLPSLSPQPSLYSTHTIDPCTLNENNPLPNWVFNYGNYSWLLNNNKVTVGVWQNWKEQKKVEVTKIINTLIMLANVFSFDIDDWPKVTK